MIEITKVHLYEDQTEEKEICKEKGFRRCDCVTPYSQYLASRGRI